jgi:uncharacterized protein YkwD
MHDRQQLILGAFSWTNVRRRAVFSLFAAIATVLVLAAGASTARAGGGCANANFEPADPAGALVAQKATRCLVNRERHRHGLRRVKFNSDLQQSAAWQAQDMLAHAYFAHERSGGPGFAGRVTRFGFGNNSNGYSLGENIAWSTVGQASPREIVSMWMQSPGHRANILRKQFHEQAISAVYSDGSVGGDFVDAGGPFIVYVSQFGTRY